MICVTVGKECQELGVVEATACRKCSRRGRVALLRYSYFALYWIFGFAWGREFLLACPNCPLETIETVPAERVGALQEKARVPFMRQFGLIMLVGALVLIGVLVSAGETKSDPQQAPPAKAAADPRAGR